MHFIVRFILVHFIVERVPFSCSSA